MHEHTNFLYFEVNSIKPLNNLHFEFSLNLRLNFSQFSKYIKYYFLKIFLQILEAFS